MKSIFKKTIAVTLASIAIIYFMGCDFNKDYIVNDKSLEKDSNDLYELNYQEQLEANNKFDHFRKELIKKAEQSNSFEDIKEYNVTYPEAIMYIESRLTFDDFRHVLKNGESHGYEADKESKYSIFQYHVGLVLEEIGEKASISFLYNGKKKRWEIFRFELLID